jgi:hypothetical protein
MILIVLRNSDSILSCYMSKIKTGFLYTFEAFMLNASNEQTERFKKPSWSFHLYVCF